MSQEAGYPLGLGPDFDRVTRQQLVDAALRFNLLFKPGERRSYSNTGYALLAAIIEQVSGRSYDEYVRDNILNPVGLRNTGFHLPKFPQDRLAHGYRAGGADAGTMLSHPHLPDGPYWNLRGNGGMLSTVSDMHEFYRALFETDKLLRPETRNARFNPREPVAMAGSDLVSFFLYERDPVLGVEMIVASNSQDYKVPKVMDQLRKIPELGGGGNREVVTDGPGPGVARRSGNPPSPAIAAIANELVAAFNSGDTAVLRAFVANRFETGPDAPRVEERMERLGNLPAELGTLEVVSMVDIENGPVEVNLKSAREGQVQMILDISRTPPYRIRRFGIQVGG
jgi:CubicO group peptidase (beta-lactamase class C family)